MISKIEDLVRMSVGTEKGSWFAEPRFGSELHMIGKVDGDTATVVQRMIQQATRWLLDDGLALAIGVEAERSGKNRVGWYLKITQPDQKTELIEGIWQV